MTPRQKILALELKKVQDGTNAALIETLKKGIVNVLVTIVGKLAELGNAATNSKSRELAIQAAVDSLERMQVAMSAHLERLTDTTARNAHEDATEELQEAGKSDLVQYDPARTESYLNYLDVQNSDRLAAVFTDKMQQNLVRSLRFAYIDVARQAAVEGMTYTEINKALQERWQKDSGNQSLYRFVDKSGRAWENARYFQMLTRTNAQRVWTDSYCDSLAANGFQLARISADGDPDCPKCAAWEGRIICVAGKRKGFPTYQDAQAAGVFHPNCTHRTEYVDETIDADEIALQSKHPPSDMSQEAMQEQKDKIDVGRQMQQGKTLDEAKAAVGQERLERYIRSGLFSDSLATVASQLPADTLKNMFDNGVPRFALAKKEDEPWAKKRGTLLVPRDATPEQLKAKLSVAAPVAPKPEPKPSATVVDGKALAATARDGIKVKMKAAGFNPSFADALPDGVAITVKDVKLENVPGARHYDLKTKTVKLDAGNWWSGLSGSMHHELGHAFADSAGIWRPGTETNVSVLSAMASDEKTVLAKLPEIFGAKWKKTASNTKNFDVDAISNHLFRKPFGSLITEEQFKLTRITDSISAVTKGKYGRGHKPGYWKNRQKYTGYNIFCDELTANCVSAISANDDNFKSFFGNSSEAVGKIIQSALDKEAVKVAK